jgi:hypothetical protein
MQSTRGNIPDRPLLPVRIYRFYRDGFAAMTLGRTLWKIILIKLLVMFGVLKLFFFPDFLQTNFASDEQRADYVLEQITLGNSAEKLENRR